MISRFLQVTLAVYALSLLVACNTSPSMQANTDFDNRFDFSGVRKIAIQPVNRMDPSTIRFSDMQIGRLNDAIAAQLVSQGYVMVDDNSEADLLLIWHLVTQEKLDVRSYNSMSYYNCWRCGPGVSDVSVRQFTQGTLIIDMIDPLRNQSVWRSIVESRLRSEPSEAAAQERRNEAVRALLAEFPPPAGGGEVR